MSSKVEESKRIWTSSRVDAGSSSPEDADMSWHYFKLRISMKFLPKDILATLTEELNLKCLT